MRARAYSHTHTHTQREWKLNCTSKNAKSEWNWTDKIGRKVKSQRYFPASLTLSNIWLPLLEQIGKFIYRFLIVASFGFSIWFFSFSRTGFSASLNVCKSLKIGWTKWFFNFIIENAIRYSELRKNVSCFLFVYSGKSYWFGLKESECAWNRHGCKDRKMSTCSTSSELPLERIFIHRPHFFFSFRFSRSFGCLHFEHWRASLAQYLHIILTMRFRFHSHFFCVPQK